MALYSCFLYHQIGCWGTEKLLTFSKADYCYVTQADLEFIII
jgi:hypothetical protein